MVRGITYNYRNSQTGDAFFDVCFVGEELNYCGTEYVVDSILMDGKSAVVHCHTVNEQGKTDKDYTITQSNVHSVLEELNA